MCVWVCVCVCVCVCRRVHAYVCLTESVYKCCVLKSLTVVTLLWQKNPYAGMIICKISNWILRAVTRAFTWQLLVGVLFSINKYGHLKAFLHAKYLLFRLVQTSCSSAPQKHKKAYKPRLHYSSSYSLQNLHVLLAHLPALNHTYSLFSRTISTCLRKTPVYIWGKQKRSG